MEKHQKIDRIMSVIRRKEPNYVLFYTVVDGRIQIFSGGRHYLGGDNLIAPCGCPRMPDKDVIEAYEQAEAEKLNNNNQ